jgi:ribosomal protein L19
MISLLKLNELKQIKKKPIIFFKSGDIIEINFFSRYLMHNFLHTFKGLCIKIKKNTLNFSCILRNVIKKISVEQSFIIYSPYVLDLLKYYNKNKKRSKLYFFRQLPRRYSKIK